MHVTIEDAHKAIEAARAKAVELETQMCIAVVDSGGNLKAFYRMDGAWVGSIDIAQKKAKTSVFFGMTTGQIGALSQPGGPLYAIEHSNEGLITFRAASRSWTRTVRCPAPSASAAPRSRTITRWRSRAQVPSARPNCLPIPGGPDRFCQFGGVSRTNTSGRTQGPVWSCQR